MPKSILGSPGAGWERTWESANPTTAYYMLNQAEGEAHSSLQGLFVPLDDAMPMDGLLARGPQGQA